MNKVYEMQIEKYKLLIEAAMLEVDCWKHIAETAMENCEEMEAANSTKTIEIDGLKLIIRKYEKFYD